MIAGVSSTCCACPACGNTNLDDVGALPPLPDGLFGGESTDTIIPAGHLIHCKICDLRFRYPSLSQTTLTTLYQNLPEKVWHGDDVRPQWPLTLKLLQRYAVNDQILDVGCFSGDLLNWLPKTWKKFGVEPSSAARQAAQKRGIQLIGETVDDVSGRSERFGAILIHDVIEHIIRPLEFLRKVQCVLADGGGIIVFTGATDAWPYRLFGRHYWYSSLPEHVSFYSRKWFTWAAQQLGMAITHHQYMSSESRNFPRWLKQFAQLSMYTSIQAMRDNAISEKLLTRLPILARATRWTHVPWWKQAKDHMITVLSVPLK